MGWEEDMIDGSQVSMEDPKQGSNGDTFVVGHILHRLPNLELVWLHFEGRAWGTQRPTALRKTSIGGFPTQPTPTTAHWVSERHPFCRCILASSWPI